MKSQYFLSLISESETHILYRFITEWNISSFYFLTFWLCLQIMTTQNSVSQKIRILQIINKKKGYFKQKCQKVFQLCILYALIQHSLNNHPFQYWPSVTDPLCGGWQWSSSGPLPSQQCSPLLCFQRTRDTRNVYCMDGHLLKLKCKYSNILRYWYLTFISCKL